MSATDKPYGWRAVPRNPSVALQGNLKPAIPFSIADIEYPDTELVRQSLARVQKELPTETLNHCFRVYYYGMSITQTHFPHFLSDGWVNAETWLLVCLFHDIGTTQENLRTTHMSFDFWGGIEALQTLLRFGADKSQAESVAEAIIRHQDPGETGTLSCVALLVQISTLFDNAGHHKELVHPDTIKDVVKKYPRNGWSGCFAETIRQEIDLKPWAHSTAIDRFAEMVENNALMKEYE
ncbi:cyanamide hydratase [Diplodia corticola]|uniref:Cyanamide hydratase n=1 Tax=Diplodia corticola TaxID=236234 RepID=A0A1J9R195_9PEZI|nr:cyanamide hydratase [Diplodia corticola]OJD35158.1 cyanamide hydratase [Diplodia corticola]